MQHALTNVQNKHRVTLTTKTHEAIADFAALAKNVASRPTRIAELIPLHPSVIGSHDASGKGAGGVIFAADHIAKIPCVCTSSHALPATPIKLHPDMTPWNALTASNRPANADPALPPVIHHPIVYRIEFPPEIQKQLVTFENPEEKINNSDLELAGSYLHHEAIVHNYDVRERTLASHADNTPTVYWQRKGAVTSISAPACLLRL